MTLEATSPPPSAAFSRKNFCSHIGSMALRILLLSTFLCIAASQTIVKTPPGYSGELPFTLETGYIGVDDSEDVQMFYYFVESQRTPLEYPLMLWLTGGPGCSTLLAFFYESGPLAFTYAGYNGSLPSLHLNPSWTKGLNVIYVDAQVGTRFLTQKPLKVIPPETSNQLYLPMNFS